jgi:pSer/pThr/pTyr-binding forkhead associated (FHA) protein
VPLTPDGLPAPGDPIPLTGREMTFGTDPTQATNVLDHPSVSPLHARLRLTDEGAFQFMDQNSVAGTWVNYEAISKDGRFLKHGDMVNFGQFTYRFVLTKPPAASKPTIINHRDG